MASSGCGLAKCSQPCGGGECCIVARKYICIGSCNTHACPTPATTPETTTTISTSSTVAVEQTSELVIVQRRPAFERAGIPYGAVAGLTVAGVVVVVVAVVVLVLIRRYFRQRKISSSSNTSLLHQCTTVVNQTYDTQIQPSHDSYLSVIYHEESQRSPTSEETDEHYTYPSCSGFTSVEDAGSTNIYYNNVANGANGQGTLCSVDNPYELVDSGSVQH